MYILLGRKCATMHMESIVLIVKVKQTSHHATNANSKVERKRGGWNICTHRARVVKFSEHGCLQTKFLASMGCFSASSEVCPLHFPNQRGVGTTIVRKSRVELLSVLRWSKQAVCVGEVPECRYGCSNSTNMGSAMDKRGPRCSHFAKKGCGGSNSQKTGI